MQEFDMDEIRAEILGEMDEMLARVLAERTEGRVNKMREIPGEPVEATDDGETDMEMEHAHEMPEIEEVAAEIDGGAGASEDEDDPREWGSRFPRMRRRAHVWDTE